MFAGGAKHLLCGERPCPVCQCAERRRVVWFAEFSLGKNRKVYGVRKLWKKAHRAGITIGLDQTARVVRSLGIAGAKRFKRVKTTTPDPVVATDPDLVKRVFSSTPSNKLWVTDSTFAPTWAGVAYVWFILEACSRMIVGWRVASHMKTETVIDAIEMARWSRGKHLPGLRCHSDAGSQFTPIRYGERLAEIGTVPSIGTVGDSFCNALAETVNGYCKAELVRGPEHPEPWETVEELELATLGWVRWLDNERLLGCIGDVLPAEFEKTFNAQNRQAKPWQKKQF